MQIDLFEALRRAGCGENNQGVVLIDGSETYHHWIEDGIVSFEVKSGSDAAFANQDVQFDDNGMTKATDTNNLSRDVRVLVTVPFNSTLKVIDLIDPPPF